MINIIEQKAELVHDGNVLLKLEKCARTCYQSQDKITEGSAVKLITSIINRQHGSCLEHVHLKLVSKDVKDRDIVYLKSIMFIPVYFNDELGQYNQVKYLRVDAQGDVVGNVRAWRNLFKTHKDNYHMNRILTIFKETCPVLFQDIPCATIVKSTDLQVLHDDDYLTIRFICNRAIGNELVRSRVFGVSQESSRYCAYNEYVTFIKPSYEWAKDIELGYHTYTSTPKYNNKKAELWHDHMHSSASRYLELVRLGASPQEARDILPLSLKTEMIMTGTTNEVIGLMNLRLSKAAHPEIRKLMVDILEEIKQSVL